MKNFGNKIKGFFIKHNFIKEVFYVESFIYVNKYGGPSEEMTDTIKWLNPIMVYCYWKNRDAKAFRVLNNSYPQYKGFINIY